MNIRLSPLAEAYIGEEIQYLRARNRKTAIHILRIRHGRQQPATPDLEPDENYEI